MVGWRTCLVAILYGMLPAIAVAATPAVLTVHADQPGAKIGPLFYGLMTEEINHSYDGGLYAELIQNRIYQDAKDRPVHWSVVSSANAAGTIAIDEDKPVNDGALKRSLRLDITAVNPGQRVGIANEGFWGIPVWPNTKYHATFYARSGGGFGGPLTVGIESNDGATTFASATVPSVSDQWKKYELDLTTADVPTSHANRFVISASSKGSVWFSLVSLFPPTFNNRPNGNRIDLMQKLADLHPAFLRFPGGNYLEGNYINEHFDWRKTLGPLEDRPGHPGCWGYRSSDGLGLLEFLEWCEDLHMEPLLAVYAGYSLKGEHVNPGPDLEPFAQEALDEIEYCTGDASTKWGQVRMKNGHPEPFKIHYIEIGNEDWFDRSGSYDGRFAQIFDAIKAKYPSLLCIATTRVRSRKPDLIDDHNYPNPAAMLRSVHRYDNYGADNPKVFFGEWATQDGRPTPTLRAALADAAWLTGLERDADTVLLNCYAPLFVNVNRGASEWGTNLIGYNATDSFGSPSYYAQAMFSRNWGDTVLPTEITNQQVPSEPAPHGFAGVGTWHTTAQFKDFKITRGNDTVLAPDASAKLDKWTPTNGTWAVKDGAIEQSDIESESRLTIGDPGWQDYTVDVKAQKTGGGEGFLVLVHALNPENYVWFNIGGWGNTRSSVEEAFDGQKTEISPSSPFTVETGRWYDVRIEVQGRDINCFIDDKLITKATQGSAKSTQTIFTAASREDSSRDLILKVVNTTDSPQPTHIDIQGAGRVSKDATVEVVRGEPADKNSVADPTRIAPKQSTIDNAGPAFDHEFPAYSVSVIRLKTQ